MADGTNIEWTDATLSPDNGFSVRSPGTALFFSQSVADAKKVHPDLCKLGHGRTRDTVDLTCCTNVADQRCGTADFFGTRQVRRLKIDCVPFEPRLKVGIPAVRLITRDVSRSCGQRVVQRRIDVVVDLKAPGHD